MGAITLDRRKSLSSRIHTFGGANGRGYRLGDDRSDIDSMLEASTSGMNYTQLLNRVNWLALYKADPEYAKSAYVRVNQKSLDPDYLPTLDQWFKAKNIVADELPVTQALPVLPVIPNNPPGQTDSDYQKSVAQAQVEAAALAALATAREAELRRQAQAQNEIVQTETPSTPSTSNTSSNSNTPVNTVVDTSATVPDDTQKKSFVLPVILGLGALYLFLKG